MTNDKATALREAAERLRGALESIRDIAGAPSDRDPDYSRLDRIDAIARQALEATDDQIMRLESISTDGPHPITEHRRWLARQLLDSKLSEAEAFEIVAHSPALKAPTHDQ